MVRFFWFDWEMVDGRFLTIFLLYLNSKALCQESDARKCVKKIIVLLNKKTVMLELAWLGSQRKEQFGVLSSLLRRAHSIMIHTGIYASLSVAFNGMNYTM